MHCKIDTTWIFFFLKHLRLQYFLCYGPYPVSYTLYHINHGYNLLSLTKIPKEDNNILIKMNYHLLNQLSAFPSICCLYIRHVIFLRIYEACNWQQIFITSHLIHFLLTLDLHILFLKADWEEREWQMNDLTFIMGKIYFHLVNLEEKQCRLLKIWK